MSLKTILAAKGDNIICIELTADLAAAAKLLSAHRIGALVVLDAAGRLVGILSERDIVRTMADVGSAVLQLPVAQVMTRNVSTCDVNDSISSVMDRMTKGKFRHMPVLDKDRLAGLVSIGDALKWQIETIRENLYQLELSITELNLMTLVRPFISQPRFPIEAVPPTLFGRADEVPYPKASLTLDDIGCNDPLLDAEHVRVVRKAG